MRGSGGRGVTPPPQQASTYQGEAGGYPLAAPVAPAQVSPVAPSSAFNAPSVQSYGSQSPSGMPWQGQPMPGYQSAAATAYPGYQGSPPLVLPGTWAPPQPGPDLHSQKSRKKRRFPIWARVGIAMMTLLVIIAGTGVWYYETYFASSINNITGHQAIHHLNAAAGGDSTSDQAASSNILNGGRINILLLGSDTDGKGNSTQNGTPLAQTDIVVTIDPQTKYVGMVSFPRDLQVSVPGYSPTKLDLAFSDGWRGNDIPTRIASAAGMTEDTLYYNFGIHIDYYAWVGLDGFIKVINTAGGVDIDAIHPMVDDDYPDDTTNSGITKGDIYGYKRLYIAPGPQHMNGAQALDYVRTRHSDLVGDFGRSARQQQMLTQLKMKLENNPSTISEAPQLLQDLNGYLETNMQLSDMIKLANFARQVDLNKVDRITLGPPYATASAVNSNYLPNCDAITPVIARVFGLGNKANCIPQVAGGSSVSGPDPNGGPTPGSTPTSNSTPTNHHKHNKGGSASVASPVASNALSLSDGLQTIDQMAQLDTLSLQGSSGEWPVVRSMLDLVFMVAFESFDGAQV
jgi:LCP family protein required for cell wall assembly